MTKTAIEKLGDAIVQALEEAPVSDVLCILTGSFVSLTEELMHRHGHDLTKSIKIDGGQNRDITIHAPKGLATESEAAVPDLPEGVAHIYPSTLKKFETEETTGVVFSVAVGCPDERSIPLFTLSQLFAYGEAQAVIAASHAPKSTWRFSKSEIAIGVHYWLALHDGQVAHGIYEEASSTFWGNTGVIKAELVVAYSDFVVPSHPASEVHDV